MKLTGMRPKTKTRTEKKPTKTTAAMDPKLAEILREACDHADHGDEYEAGEVIVNNQIFIESLLPAQKEKTVSIGLSDGEIRELLEKVTDSCLKQTTIGKITDALKKAK